MKVLFLYTELAGYFLTCCETLARSAEVHVVRWPVNPEAPFAFHFPNGVHVYEKADHPGRNLEELVNGLHPDVIVCSGWVDKDYLRVVRRWRGKAATVLISDTRWKGTLRQILAIVLSRLFLTRHFSHAWVPGNRQAKYLRLLGFGKKKIRTGYYCCDLQRFNGIHERVAPSKSVTFPRRFIFSGRYYTFKGITDLWAAFLKLKKETGTDWELWCLGTGSVPPTEADGIRHFGFVQPSDLEPVLAEAGVFVLPSRVEPWGVVVQEFAAAGFPLLLSDRVGAAETFLDETNGMLFNAGDRSGLLKAMKKIVNLNSDDLNAMGAASHRLAQRITPTQWAGTVTAIWNEFSEK